MQSLKLRISDRNASIIKEQFIEMGFNYHLFRVIKGRVKVTVDGREIIERREWYDIVLNTNQHWCLPLKRYFETLQNHQLISHLELI